MISRRLLEIIRYYHCTTSNEISLPVQVELKQGTVFDREQTITNGNPYNYMKGVPYTVPSLDELSFKAPISLKGFYDDEIDYMKKFDLSFQNDTTTDFKDSLFLNVFTPKNKIVSPMPVMLFTYDFDCGNIDLSTPHCLMQEDVVVVTLNYFNGPYGFLALPGGNAPVIAAIKDQRLALEWIKENISQFNGDPSNITLLGESSGEFRSTGGVYIKSKMESRLRNYKIR